jgi:hypothetical protein
VLPNWNEIDESIKVKCVAPRVGRASPESKYPAYVRCFGRVTGPRSSIWFPSWTLRVGYVLNQGLLFVVPVNLQEFGFSMFDVTGLTPEQYALEGLYTHASTFQQGSISVVDPFKSAIAGKAMYTVQDARNHAEANLIYETIATYGDRNYLLIAAGTKSTLPLSRSDSFSYAVAIFFAMTFLAGFMATFLIARNRSRIAHQQGLLSMHDSIVGHICQAMRSALHSVLFFGKGIQDSIDRLSFLKATTQGNELRLKALVEAVGVLDATTGSMCDLVNSFMGLNEVNTTNVLLNLSRCDCISVATAVFAQHRVINVAHLEMEMV